MATLTALNSTIMLAVASVYPTAQQLQGYAADDIFDVEDIEVAETVMGIDGLLSGGLIYVPVPWTITLQGNSASNSVFDGWYNYQKAIGDVTTATLNIALPGLGYKWIYSNGFLKKYSPAPSAKKIVQPRKFMVEFNTISVQPI